MTEREKKEIEYYRYWSKKSPRLIRKEIKSFEKYFERNEPSYNWHGRYTNHPDELTDGDRIRILNKLIEI